MKLTGFDKFTAAIAPKWTLNRVRARAALNAVRNYEAAQTGRRTSGWNRNRGDADVVAAPALAELRMHARDLVRNNSYARQAQRTIANNTVGWGIVPNPTGVEKNVADAALDIWKRWAETTECDSERRLTFYGLQELVMKSLFESGEVFLRRRNRKAKDGLTLPLQLQVLEADYLDTTKDSAKGQTGGPIVYGVEFDAIGRRAAYWMFDNHPGSGLQVGESRRIEASDICHVFQMERPGQTRGVSWLAAAIVNLKELDEYEDAELMRQKVAACFAAFVTDPNGSADRLGGDEDDDDRLDALGPGMVEHLEPGKQVTFSNPPTVVNDSFAVRNLRKIAAGVGISYEMITGDYSQVNFSSARMSRLAHWANVHSWQYNMLIPILCQGVWDWAMTAAVLTGQLPEVPGSEWSPPPMPMIEPDKEGLALGRLVRVGAMTHAEMIRQQGRDPKKHFAEYAEGLTLLDELKIDLDSDVRRVSAAGLTQERVGFGQGEKKAGEEKERADEVDVDEMATLARLLGGEQ